MSRSYDDIARATAVVIPAYNAGPHLADVIEDTSRVLPKSQIIVVDDGSSDDTIDVAHRSGVVVERHVVNQGKGVALRTGLQKALDMGLAYAITLDADGQHNPAEIPKFIEHMRESDADIIVGNRMDDTKDMPLIRVLTNRFTSGFVSLAARTRVPDSQNGYRMIKTAVFGKLEFEMRRYDFESEILIRAGRRGARIDSIPVETIYGDETSTINPVVDTARFFRLVFKSFFW